MVSAKRNALLLLDKRQYGFSLTEVMVVIGVVAILSAIAIPNILTFRENARLRAAASEMLSTFRKAQISAVKRNYNTVLIFDTAAGTTTVFLDNGGGVLGNINNSTQNAGEPTLEVYSLPTGCKITGDTFGGQTGFTPRGLPVGIAGAIEIHPTSASSKIAYKITLSTAGHSKLLTSTDGGTSSSWK